MFDAKWGLSIDAPEFTEISCFSSNTSICISALTSVESVQLDLIPSKN